MKINEIELSLEPVSLGKGDSSSVEPHFRGPREPADHAPQMPTTGLCHCQGGRVPEVRRAWLWLFGDPHVSTRQGGSAEAWQPPRGQDLHSDTMIRRDKRHLETLRGKWEMQT